MAAIGAFWTEKMSLFLQRSGRKEKIIMTQKIPPHFCSQDWGVKMTGIIPFLMGAHETFSILTLPRCWDSYISYSLKNNVKVTMDFLNNFFSHSLNTTCIETSSTFLFAFCKCQFTRITNITNICLIVFVLMFYSKFKLIVIPIYFIGGE